MRSIFLGMLLAVVSNTAMAEWIKFGENSHQDGYYDPASIERDGNIVKVSILNNFNQAMPFGNKSALSMINKFEFDCKKKLVKLHTMTMLSENMGQGRTTYTDDSPTKWEKMDAAGTIEYPSFNLICVKVTSTSPTVGWVKFSENAAGISYFDPKSIHHKDGKSTATIMVNMSSAMPIGEKPALSMVTKFEFDCEKKLMRLGGLYMFADNMGRGEKVLSSDTASAKWDKANADGTNEYPSLKVVCE